MTASILTLLRNDIAPKLPEITAVGTVILVRPPGTGKSWMARQLSADLGVSFYPFASNPDALASDVLGSMLPKEDGTGQWGFVSGACGHPAGRGPRYGFKTSNRMLCLETCTRPATARSARST